MTSAPGEARRRGETRRGWTRLGALAAARRHGETRRGWVRLGVLAAALGLGGAPGCGAAEERSGPSPAERSAEVTGGTFARIELRAHHHWTPPRGEPEGRLDFSAAFVQHMGIGALAARAQLGIAPAGGPLEPGRCRPLESSPGAGAAAAPSPLVGAAGLDPDGEEVVVELLDAGAIYVTLPGQSTLVRPVIHPDVLPHVSGVHYRATLSQAEEGLSLRVVSLQGFGGRDMGTFEVMRRAGPVDFRILQVAGSPPSEAPFAVPVTGPLLLRWSPVGGHAEVRVRLRLRVGEAAGVSRGSGRGQQGRGRGAPPAAAAQGVECRPEAPGRFVLRPAELALARPGVAGRDVVVQVVATRREAFRLPDGTPGRLILSQSDAVTLTLMP